LPYILAGLAKTLCLDLLTNILYSKRQNGYSGSDLCVALIETFKLLYFQWIDESIKKMLSTAVNISEILYSAEEKRRATKINFTTIIITVHGCTMNSVRPYSKLHDITYPRLFGAYLHALVVCPV
jgi:hypothetical protein